MSMIDSTPQFVKNTYETMRHNLNIVRRRLKRPLTLSDKILLSHLEKPEDEEQDLVPGKSYLQLRPDRVILQDVLGQSAMLQFMQTGLKRVAVPTTIHCDHLIEARVEGNSDLAASLDENKEVYDFLKSAAAKYGAGFWGPGAGIIHQVNLENYAFPGAVILGTDSHTPNAGGLGACAVGVGGADAIDAMAGLTWEVLYPKHIGVKLTGALSGWTAPKDIILYLAGALTVSGGTNAIIEYFGPGAESLSCTGKATITNMGAELGATTSLFGYDKMMSRYLQATGRRPLADLALDYQEMLVMDDEVLKNPAAFYEKFIEIDLSKLEPYVVGPHSPDRARPLSELEAEIHAPGSTFVDDISACLIGSCTNSSYEDMCKAADIAEQARSQGIESVVPLFVTPGSEQIRATIERDGQMATLQAIGATVLANACGPCIGQWKRDSEIACKPNTIVTSYNRNFPCRNDGQSTTMNFLASPEITIAFALAGKLSFNPITDLLAAADGTSFILTPPRKAPDIPQSGYLKGKSEFIEPPDDGSDLELQVSPNSERLQILEPWPAWDGSDVSNAAILLKAQGKTTTDAISPAGPWLRLRGHLDKFSNNMFMGAVNAFTGMAGSGLNVLTGENNVPLSAIARYYKKNQVKWVVIGDWNYGEGSSREHAALSPRLLGAAAIISRSFARIHESNLKKQGLLALTFIDPDDYEKICVDDRIDILGLHDFLPDKSIICLVRHMNGTQETIQLRHSYNSDQIKWFRAGSALNLLRYRHGV